MEVDAIYVQYMWASSATVCKQQMLSMLEAYVHSQELRRQAFGENFDLHNWAVKRGNYQQQKVIFGSPEQVKLGIERQTSRNVSAFSAAAIASAIGAAGQAIIPLSLGMFFVLFIILREKIKPMDEVILGVALAVVGMSIFNIGIDFR